MITLNFFVDFNSSTSSLFAFSSVLKGVLLINIESITKILMYEDFVVFALLKMSYFKFFCDTYLQLLQFLIINLSNYTNNGNEGIEDFFQFCFREDFDLWVMRRYLRFFVYFHLTGIERKISCLAFSISNQVCYGNSRRQKQNL